MDSVRLKEHDLEEMVIFHASEPLQTVDFALDSSTDMLNPRRAPKKDRGCLSCSCSQSFECGKRLDFCIVEEELNS
jgi:hypothetical protein